jgi:hypothetical protein
MASHPLTHHEILGLIEPFARRGRHPDLAASDRLERRLMFKPRLLPGTAADAGPLSETLKLENAGGDTWRLTRLTTHACGLTASLEVEGEEVGELLSRIEAVPPGDQFSGGAGFVLARSHRLPRSAAAADRSAPTAGMRLLRGVVRFEGLTLTLKVPTVKGIPGDLEFTAVAGERVELPEDLLAVLGWDWSALSRVSEGWRGSVRLCRREQEHSADAAAKLALAAAHVAQALAEPPARFHHRHVAARWGVYARRAIPLLCCFALIGGAALVPSLDLAHDSVARMLIFNSPPILMMLLFCMREVPRIEIPPWPRPSAAATWRAPQAVAAVAPADGAAPG